MNRKMKRLVAAMLLCTMVCLTGVTALATEHKCAFSYMGNSTVSDIHVSSHTYLKYNTSTGMYDTCICQVRQRVQEEIWKCACGKKEARNRTTKEVHSGCGK